ncbi:unnamed protein product [Closterium sp. Yama58-4]|nr:unnamed protein product [Closterium sp. Yama58-4]
MEAATVVLLSQTDHHLFEVAHPRLDVFDSPRCTRLATQAWMGRRLVALAAASIEPRLRDPEIAAVHSGSHEAQRPLGSDVARGAIPIRLCEDAYPGWISAADVAEGAIRRLSIGSESARREAGSAGDGGTERRNGGGGGCEGGGSAGKGGMEGVREAVAAFAEAARAESNRYLWGGTTGPHFDCSGLAPAAAAHLLIVHASPPHRACITSSSCMHHLLIVHASPPHRACITSSSCMHHLLIVHASPPHRACITSSSCMHHLPIVHASPPHRACITSPSCMHHLLIVHASPPHRACITSPSCMHHLLIVHASPPHRACITSSSCMHHLLIVHASPPHRACITSPSCMHHLLIVHASPPHRACITSSSCMHHLPIVHASPPHRACITSSSCMHHLPIVHASPPHRACITGWQVFFGTARATHVGIVTCAKLCKPRHHTPPLPTGSSRSHVCDSNPSAAWHTVQVAFLHSSGRHDGHDGIVSDCLRLLLPCPPRRTRLTCGKALVLREHADGSGDACGCCGGVDNEGEGGSGEERRVGAQQEWVSAEGGSRACGAGEAGEAGEWKVVKRWHVGSREVGSREVGSREVGSREVGSREVGSREVGSREVGSREVGSREVGSREVGSREVGSREVGSREVGRKEVGRKGDSAQAPVEVEKGHRQEGGMAVVGRHTAGREETVLAEGGMGAAEVGEAVEVQAQGRVAAHYGAQLRGFGHVLHALPPSLAHIPPHLVLPLQL